MNVTLIDWCQKWRWLLCQFENLMCKVVGTLVHYLTPTYLCYYGILLYNIIMYMCVILVGNPSSFTPRCSHSIPLSPLVPLFSSVTSRPVPTWRWRPLPFWMSCLFIMEGQCSTHTFQTSHLWALLMHTHSRACAYTHTYTHARVHTCIHACTMTMVS